MESLETIMTGHRLRMDRTAPCPNARHPLTPKKPSSSIQGSAQEPLSEDRNRSSLFRRWELQREPIGEEQPTNKTSFRRQIVETKRVQRKSRALHPLTLPTLPCGECGHLFRCNRYVQYRI